MRELAGPATNAITFVAIAGAAASLHFSGRVRGAKALVVAEVAAVLATAAFCARHFWRKEPQEAGDPQLPGKVAEKAAQFETPTATDGCCGGASGACCDREHLGDDEEQGQEGDLEDLQSSGDEIKSVARAAARATYLQPKAARRRAGRSIKKDRQEDEAGSEDVGFATSVDPPGCADETSTEGVFLPGRAKVYFKTFGCSHNVSDSEYMQGLLHEAGYGFVDRLEEADVCVVNSCTVKSPSEFALYSAIKAALGMTQSGPSVPGSGGKRNGAAFSKAATTRAIPGCSDGDCTCETAAQGVSTPSLRQQETNQHERPSDQFQQPSRRIPCVVAGCVPGASKVGGRETRDRESSASWQEALLAQCSVVGVSRISRIVEVVEEALQGRIVRLTGGKGLPPLDLPKIRRNRLIEIVPISTGCLGNCTYCKTKHARGDLGSYPEEAIEARVRSAVEQGATQIWLTSEDTGRPTGRPSGLWEADY